MDNNSIDDINKDEQKPTVMVNGEKTDVSGSQVVAEYKKPSVNPIALAIIIVALIFGFTMIYEAYEQKIADTNKYMTETADDVDNDAKPNVEQDLNDVSDIEVEKQIIVSVAPTADNSYFSGSTSKSSGWEMISVGLTSSCGIKYDNKLYCWGSSAYGPELGRYDVSESDYPLEVNLPNGAIAKYVAAGYGANCAITLTDKLYCWGALLSWDGVGISEPTPYPTLINGGVLKDMKIASVYINYYGACVISDTGLVYCWGNDAYKGKNFDPIAKNATGILSGKTISHMSSRNDHTCVTTDEQQVYCWYNASYGTLHGRNIRNLDPVKINTGNILDGKQILQISSGSGSDCVLTDDGNVYCWGYGNYGELGNNSANSSQSLISIYKEGALKDKRIISVTSGDFSRCALDSAGVVYCWGGIGGKGTLGNRSDAGSMVPTEVYMDGAMKGSVAVGVMMYDDNVCAVGSDDELYCWGDNEYNSLNSSLTKLFKEPIKMFSSRN